MAVSCLPPVEQYSNCGHQDNLKPGFFFFYEKILNVRTKKAPKRKQTILTFLEVFSRAKMLRLLFSVCLILFCYLVFVCAMFFYAQNFFVKKKNKNKKKHWFEIVLMTSFTILLTCNPIDPPIKNLFAHTYFYLFESLIICENLFFL